jgi:uracil-DNA glycosylase family 4
MGKSAFCCGYSPPDNFNGLMIVGEGPGAAEVVQGRPFVGASGRLLRSILKSIGANLDECYITNATLCKPPPDKRPFHQRHMDAITNCLPRLRAEIELVRPRVIVTLGNAALIALTGRYETRSKYVAFACDNCNPQRKVGPALQCSATVRCEDGTSAPCGCVHYLRAQTPETQAQELETLRAGGCLRCGSSLKRLRPKMVKCPKCGGRKMRTEEYEEFVFDYNVMSVLGALFEPVADASSAPSESHELAHWLRECGVRYVIPTVHPSMVLQSGDQYITKAMQKHFQKAHELLRRDAAPATVPYRVTKDPAEVRAWAAAIAPTEPLAVDIETDAKKVRDVTVIRCIGLATRDEALVVDTREASDELLDTLYDVLCDEHPKVYQNGHAYDIPVMIRVWGMRWQELIMSYADDTLLAHHVLYPDEAHDLQYIASSFLDVRAWKPPRGQMHEDFEQLARYNARDCVYTARSARAMGAIDGACAGHKLARAGLAAAYNQDMEMMRVAVGMAMRGMPRDADALAELDTKLSAEVEGHLQRMREIVQRDTRIENPEAFNPNSTAELARVLHDTSVGYGVPLGAVTATGQPVLDQGTLRRYVAAARPGGHTDYDRAAPLLTTLLEYKKTSKILSTYVQGSDMQPWSDGRFHPTWLPFGTRTGRFSSNPNFQNWPKWLRSFVVAPKGRAIVGADYSQLELRGVAALSGDATLIRLCMDADEDRKLEPEFDPHSYVSQVAFRESYTKLALKDPNHNKANPRCTCETCRRKALRDIAKRVIYGLNYGAEAPTILAAIYDGGYEGPTITLAMVEGVQRAIRKAFPGVFEWRTNLVEETRRTQQVRSPLIGRRRIFPLGDIPVTEVYNFPIQSLAADIMNDAVIRLDAALEAVDRTAWIIAQVHDAVYVECAEDKAAQVAEIVTNILTVEHVLVPGAAPMLFPASAVVAKNWKDAA